MLTATDRRDRTSRPRYRTRSRSAQDSYGWQHLHFSRPIRKALPSAPFWWCAQVWSTKYCRQPHASVSSSSMRSNIWLNKLTSSTNSGLIGFLLSLTPLSNDLMGWRGAGSQNGAASIGVYYFFGGVLMITSAVLEVRSYSSMLSPATLPLTELPSGSVETHFPVSSLLPSELSG